jgi:hypothetical protein
MPYLDSVHDYFDLVGVVSDASNAYRSGMPLVDPASSDPRDSYLWLIINDGALHVGGRSIDYAPPPTDELDIIRRWIVEEEPPLPPHAGCDIPAAERPSEVVCPTVEQPVVNGDFESGKTGWDTPDDVVDDGTGNHVLAMSEYCGHSVGFRVFVAAPSVALHVRFRADPAGMLLPVLDVEGVVRFNAPPDGSWADVKACVTQQQVGVGVQIFYMHGSTFRGCGSTSNPFPEGYATGKVYIDDVSVDPDPTCGLPDAGP